MLIKRIVVWSGFRFERFKKNGRGLICSRDCMLDSKNDCDNIVNSQSLSLHASCTMLCHNTFHKPYYYVPLEYANKEM